MVTHGVLYMLTLPIQPFDVNQFEKYFIDCIDIQCFILCAF